MTTQKATVNCPRHMVYQIIVEQVDVTGRVNESLPIITLPTANYEHARQIEAAINNVPKQGKK